MPDRCRAFTAKQHMEVSYLFVTTPGATQRVYVIYSAGDPARVNMLLSDNGDLNLNTDNWQELLGILPCHGAQEALKYGRINRFMPSFLFFDELV